MIDHSRCPVKDHGQIRMTLCPWIAESMSELLESCRAATGDPGTELYSKRDTPWIYTDNISIAGNKIFTQHGLPSLVYPLHCAFQPHFYHILLIYYSNCHASFNLKPSKDSKSKSSTSDFPATPPPPTSQPTPSEALFWLNYTYF